MSLDEWNPMAEHYSSAYNTYSTGAGAKMPGELQPAKYKRCLDDLFSLYISRIPESLDAESLRNIFCKFGRVKSITTDPSAERYWAILSYETQEAANNAISQMNDHPDYQFKVQYKKNNGERNYKPSLSPPSFSKTEAASLILPVRNMNINDLSSDTRPLNKCKKSLPSFQFSPGLFPVDQSSKVSLSGSMVSLNSAEVERKPMPRCAQCNKVTWDKCTGCDVHFCTPGCMIVGYTYHIKNCIQLPDHSSERKSNGYDKSTFSSPFKDITRFDKENYNDQVETFTEDTKNYMANCPQKPYIPRTISNNYDDEAGGDVAKTTNSRNSFGDENDQVSRNMGPKGLPAEASNSNYYDNKAHSDTDNNAPENTGYQQKDCGHVSQENGSKHSGLRGSGSMNRGVRGRGSVNRSGTRPFNSRNIRDASKPQLPTKKDSWDEDENRNTSNHRDSADDRPNLRDDRRNQNNLKMKFQGNEKDNRQNTTEVSETLIRFGKINEYKNNCKNQTKNDSSRNRNYNNNDKGWKMDRKPSSEAALDRSVYSTNRLAVKQNCKYKVRLMNVFLPKGQASPQCYLSLVEEQSLLQQLQEDLAAEMDLKPGIIKKHNHCIVCQKDDRLRGVIMNESPVTVLRMDKGGFINVDANQVKEVPPKFENVPAFMFKAEFIDGTTRGTLTRFEENEELFEIIARNREKNVWKVELVQSKPCSRFDEKLEKARRVNDERERINRKENSGPVDNEPSCADTKADRRKSDEDRSINQGNSLTPVNSRSTNADARADKSPRLSEEKSTSQESNLRSVTDRLERADISSDVSRPNKVKEANNDAAIIQKEQSTSHFSFTLKEKEPTEVCVTYISNDSCFYVGNRKEMSLMAKEILKHKPDDLPALEDISKGSYCLGLYDEIWHRARLVDTNPLKVYYLDFGNTATVDREQLKAAPPELVAINPLAIYVELDKADGTVQDYEILELDDVKILPIKRGDSKKPWIVSVKQTLRVYSTYDVTRTEYFVIEEGKNESLLEITELPRTPIGSPIRVGSMYFTFYDGCACRVSVTKMSPLTVLYIDYGNEEILKDDSELYDLPDNWKNIPPMAFRIMLDKDPGHILPLDQLLTISKKLDSETWSLIPNSGSPSSPLDCRHAKDNVSRVSADDLEPINDLTTMEEVTEKFDAISIDLSDGNMDYDNSDFEHEDQDSGDDGIFSTYEEEFEKFRSIVKKPKFAHVISEIQSNSVVRFIRTEENSIYGTLMNDQLKKRLNSMKKDFMKLNVDTSYRPKKGDLVACCWGVRAIVLHESTLLEPRYKLFTIDFGGILMTADIAPLPERYKNVPASSVKCIIESLEEGSEDDKIVQQVNRKYLCEIQFSDSKKGYCKGVMYSVGAKNGARYCVKFKRYRPSVNDFGLDHVPLKTGDLVKISSFNTANDCFITPINEDFEEDLIDMADAINMYAKKSLSLKEDPSVGEIVAVYERTRGTYCRGVVLEYIKAENHYKVDLVDKGRIRNSVTRNQMKALPTYLKVRRRATVPVKLHGVRINETNERVKEFLRKDEIFKLVIIDGDPVEVQLKFLKDRMYSLKEVAGAATANEYLDNLLTPYWLIGVRENKTFEPRRVMYEPSMTERWIDGNIMPLRVADYLGEGAISVVDENASCQKKIIQMNLEERIQEFCQYFKDNYVPVENEICLAKGKNGKWGRAVSLRNVLGNKIKVQFLDTGKIAELWQTDLRRIEREFVCYKFAAAVVIVTNYEKGLNLEKLVDRTVSCKILEDIEDGWYNVEIDRLEEIISSIDEKP